MRIQLGQRFPQPRMKIATLEVISKARIRKATPTKVCGLIVECLEICVLESKIHFAFLKCSLLTKEIIAFLFLDFNY